MNDTEKKSPSLEESRAAIDRIDRELVALFCERMQVATDVAAYKAAHDLPVTDAARERALLARVSELQARKWRHISARYMPAFSRFRVPISTRS